MRELMPHSPHSVFSQAGALHTVDGVDLDRESVKDY